MRGRRRAHPGAPLRGTISVPGDKSISHRALLLAALARGRSRVTGLNLGADVLWTAECLRRLGVPVALDEGKIKADVEGKGHGHLHEADDVLYAGNSGTTLRLMAGICASLEGVTVLTGDESLRERPMLRVVAPLRQMGADVDGRRHGDRPPLFIRGRRLHAIDLEMSVPSAQVKSAVLLAALAAEGTTTVIEPQPSRDHTERMLAAAGIEVKRGAGGVSVAGGRDPEAMRWDVPGDPSSAAFLVVAALLLEGSDVTVSGVGLNPTRIAYLDVLQRMGAELETTVTREVSGEPVGDLRVRASSLRAVEMGGEEIPRIIDEIPVLAVAASQAEGTTVIRDAGELRVKESDRVEAMVEGLAAMGADVEASPDGLRVGGPRKLHGAAVDSRGDHRVALALAVAGLVAGDRMRIEGWSSVNTSFPEFLDVLGDARSSR